jgi:arylsulfatase A-like enzyme
VTAALLVALVDGCRTAWTIGLSALETCDLLIGLLGFYLTVALIMGLVEGSVGAGLSDYLGQDALHRLRPRRLRAALLEDPQLDARWAATVSALPLLAALPASLVLLFHLLVSSSFANQTLVGVYLAGISALGVVAAGLLFFPTHATLRRLWGRMPTMGPLPRTAVALVSVGAVGLGAVAVALGRASWEMTNFGPVLALTQLMTFQAAIAYSSARLGGRARSAVRSWVPAAIALLAVVVGLFRASSSFNESQRLRAAAVDASWTGYVLVAFGRALTDRDGDGYSGCFGGGDCDDSNPRAHPGARDLAGDGVDQDCVGGDATPPAPPHRTRREELPAGHPLRSLRFDGNILMIFVDALRADRLAANGHDPRLTPNINRLVSQSVYFERAFAQGNRTPQSFTSLLTSRYPSRIELDRPASNFPTLRESNITLFEKLAEAGYRNVGVTRHYYFKRVRNLHQGFARGDWINRPVLTIDQQNRDISAPDITLRAIKRLRGLRESGSPFALLVHYHDPHHDYMDHPELEPIPSERTGLARAYDSELHFTDRYVGELLDALEATGLADSTCVVLFSDHGETFGRRVFRGRRAYYHGHTLYNELIHVPLALRLPGLAPRKVEVPVMLIDLAPTLLELIDQPVPASFSGSSLLPYLVGGKLPERIIRAESLPYANWTDHVVAMIKGRWKLIYRIRDNIFELYDLENDPEETVNLAASHPDVLRDMKKKITSY